MKLTRYIQLIVALIAVTMISGCTQNNGDIGEWFGEWHLKTIEINGVDDDKYDGDVLWKFQNNIVEMVVVSKTGHSHTEHYGTWSADDRTLTLNFTHSDDLNAAGTGKYAPPAQTLLPAAVTDLRIVKLSSREIILQYNPDSATAIVYTLAKRG